MKRDAWRVKPSVVEAKRVLRAERSGSSCPVLVETADGIRFTKLRGAAQGTAPLVAELIVAELAEALDLRVPARSLVELPPDVESLDRNDELADVLRASAGINLGFAYLADARPIDPAEIDRIDVETAAAIMWLDGLVMNPDRTLRNPNLLWSGGQLHLIDHGAALGFHYAWLDVDEDAPRRPMAVREAHVLESRVSSLAPFDDRFAACLTRYVMERAVAIVPDELLQPLLGHIGERTLHEALQRRRAAYAAFLWKRLRAPRPFLTSVRAAEPRRGRPIWLARRQK